MKTKLLLLMCALLLLAAGCGSPSVPEATEAFCQSLVVYGESLTTLENLSPESTVGELQDAQKAEQRARQDVKDAASDLRAAKLNAIDEAWATLDKTIRQIGRQDTLAEVAAQIRLDLSETRTAYEQLGLNNCPDLFPTPIQGASEPAADQAVAPGQPITGTQTITGTEPMTGTQATAPVTATAASTATEALPAPGGPAEEAPVAPPGPFGTWQLQSIESATGSVMTPSDPAQYTLILQPDGQASVTAECIAGTGTYQVAGTTISFSIQYSTAACSPSAMAHQYTKYLDYATSFEWSGSTLVIWYSYGSGKMTFTQAAP